MKEMVGGCCVCSDDRGWSENPLVYCDGQSCAVAVHQACYGIVTVPSGPWYCRKCESQERSARVRCELCPSRDGALKRTDNQGWAHVVCALYIPEVRFGNVTTMEPIILQLIPQERYSKTCYICQEMGKASRSTVGACMQCNKSGCKQQFHVTCAQQLGLLCEEAGNYLDNVKYCGYCQHHYSKLKKGGNVKTIPPYKPISHETNSSDGPSSPEKELEPPPTQQHSSGSGLGSTSGIKSTNRLPNEQTAGPPLASSSSSSKQRKSSGASKGSTNTSMAPGSTIMSGPGNTNSTGIPSQPSSIAPGLPGMNSMAAMSNVTGSSLGKTSSSSTSSSSKDKDKYNKNISKVSSTNKGHEKDPSNASASSSSSSSQRDKGSKSSKSSTSGGNSNIGVIGTTSSIVSHTGSNVSNPMLKESDPALMSSSTSSNAPPHSTTMKHQPDSGTIKQEKTLAQISSAAVSSARAASLSPAAIPTTLIIKPPQDHSGNSKDILSKETIAKFTTSNFTETIVVNSDSVFGANAPGNPGLEPIGSNTGSLGGNTGGPPLGPISVIESGSASANVKMNLSGENPYSGGSAGGAKKRKADARSTPTFTSGDIDINRDLIKDVAVSLVPLPLNKNDSIDPASISGIEKSIKKAKTEPNSPHTPTADPNLQNLNPNLLQSSHASNVISSSIKHQQQPNSPQLPPPTSQQQQQGQLHTPSLVVSVPLSTATVPGVNLPTSNSGSSTGISSSSSSTSSSGPTNTTSNVPNVSSGSNSIINTPNIVSPGQMPPGTSLYQQLTQRSGEQFMGASANRSSPVIQQQTSHVIQNPAHVILERQSPSMRSSPAIITSAGGPQQAAHSFGTSGTLLGMDLNPQPGNPVSVLQSISPVPMNAIQSTSSSPITMGGEGGGGGLKISYEAQTPNARIAALQEEEFMGRRSSFGSNSSFSGGGGLKFSYEAQPTSNSITIGATSTIITPQATVKESPPSSPGSDSGMGTRNSSGAGNKRNRKLSTHSNVGGPLGLAGPPEAKESKLFQNGVVHASHMLGNQLNPNSTMAQKMSDQLSMEIETHTTFVEAAPQLVGPPFPGKQAVRPSNPAPTGGGGNSLSSMLTGSATATANGNTPQSLEQLLERQWEQGSQFLMEQAQHFDIASLLSCLHQLRSENVRLEEHVNNLIARRDHLLAVNARLAIPLNPAAMGGVGLGGGGGGAGNTGSGGGGSGNTGGSSGGSTGGGGSSAAGSQASPLLWLGQFNNMHGNGPHEGGGGSSTSTTTISSRNSRIQQHQSQNQQQQQSQSHFGSNTSSSNPVPLENGIDFRHSNSNHPNTNNSSIRHHSPSNQSCAPSSNATSNRQSSSSSGTGGGSISEPPSQSSHHPRASGRGGTHNSNSSGSGSSSATNTTSSNVFQVQQQTIYNTAHQIPLLLEHHQQEHHSQQHHPPLPSVQAAPHGAHHLRQTSPTVPSSRAHQSRDHNTSRVAVPDGANLPPSLGPPSSHSHHPVSSIHSSSQQPPPPAPSTLPPHHHITPPHHQVQSSGHPPPPPPPHVQQQRQRH
ncbi:protein AF-10 isoform X6 [Uranotaenia lowii]|uniref:protein AF-10 isoform X6 n=1 Tax=Uranotaenia lowii TaxID=190385 RepID=UPI00247A81A9|nr:protein AF-10 isoform X6 [Uranotaenia lowii]